LRLFGSVYNQKRSHLLTRSHARLYNPLYRIPLYKRCNGHYTTYTCYTRCVGSPAYVYSLYSIQRVYSIQPIHYTALYTSPLRRLRDVGTQCSGEYAHTHSVEVLLLLRARSPSTYHGVARWCRHSSSQFVASWAARWMGMARCAQCSTVRQAAGRVGRRASAGVCTLPLRRCVWQTRWSFSARTQGCPARRATAPRRRASTEAELACVIDGTTTHRLTERIWYRCSTP
jgi:hypothetical protein